MNDPAAEPGYSPTFSPDEVERIRAWHEQAYTGMKQREVSEVEYLGRAFTVPPQVFPPTPMSDLLGRAVLSEVRAADRVLDMGTGSGVNAVLAASRASDVLGVDVNPYAVACARENAARNGVASRTRFLESDVFEGVEGSFDLIVFDPPFRWFAPRDELEASIADEGYGALRRFMAEAPARLREGGRILLFFGSSGDVGFLRALIDRSGFHAEVIAERDLARDGWTVRYQTFRLTVRAR